VIVPTLEDLLVLRAVARGWSLHAPVAARAALLGSHRSAYRGRGLEFQEVRPYVAGDDPRSIDWRVTARRGRPHTKLFQEERERPVWVVVDLHAGMFFGSRRQLKSTVALRAAALLAWAAEMGGDRVGAVIAGASGATAGAFGAGAVGGAPNGPHGAAGAGAALGAGGAARAGGAAGASGGMAGFSGAAGTPRGIAGASRGEASSSLRVLPPRAREAGVLPILETLIELQPTAPGVPARTSLQDALLSLAPLVHPGSLVLAVSDFANLDAQAEVLWSKLAAHSECRLFWVTDSLEAQGLPDGLFRGGLPNQLRIVDGAKTRSAWIAAWREREARLDALAQRHRMPLVRLDTAESTEDVLRPVLRGPKAAA
jgi:Protein of unknown function DUF58